MPKDFTSVSSSGTIITMMQLPSIRQPRIRKITLMISSTTKRLSVMEVMKSMNSWGIWEEMTT